MRTEWRDKEGSPVETTEYTLEELKKEFPFVDQVQIFNLRHIENFGRSALSTTKQTQQVWSLVTLLSCLADYFL